MDETVDLAGLIHEDKCRYWNDEEFCDCGAVDYELLKRCKVERDRYKTALEEIQALYPDANPPAVLLARGIAREALNKEV